MGRPALAAPFWADKTTLALTRFLFGNASLAPVLLPGLQKKLALTSHRFFVPATRIIFYGQPPHPDRLRALPSSPCPRSLRCACLGPHSLRRYAGQLARHNQSVRLLLQVHAGPDARRLLAHLRYPAARIALGRQQLRQTTPAQARGQPWSRAAAAASSARRTRQPVIRQFIQND